MKALIQAVKGTRDFYPEDMAIRTWLYNKIRQVSESFGYQEYEGPLLERIDLYAAKSGDELVNQQSFVFKDRGGDTITLRPELTPTLTRMIAQKQNELVFPLRWWSYGPFWRYERPQKGRTREFFQWNIDLIGVNTPEADAELVAICAEFFKKVGLTPSLVQIHVNNRALMNTELERIQVPAELRPNILQVIDRRNKMDPSIWDAYALESGLSPIQLEELKSLLSDPELWKKWPDFHKFFSIIEVLGLEDYIRYDAGIIRGLTYYTGFVFEAFEKEGGRALLGGGRYDNLVSDVGGAPLPGIGVAMGDVMITIVLEKYNLLPPKANLSNTILVTVFDENCQLSSLDFASAVRQTGLPVVCYPEIAKLPKQLKFADRMGIRFAVIIGPDEVTNHKVTIKDLSGHDQETVDRDLAAGYLLQLLAQ